MSSTDRARVWVECAAAALSRRPNNNDSYRDHAEASACLADALLAQYDSRFPPEREEPTPLPYSAQLTSWEQDAFDRGYRHGQAEVTHDAYARGRREALEEMEQHLREWGKSWGGTDRAQAFFDAADMIRSLAAQGNEGGKP